MKLEELKVLVPNVEYKQMEYQENRKIEILFTGEYMGYRFYILNLGTHPTAYIEIPEGHDLFGKHYDDINIDVHGGLTYAEDHLRGVKENSWFIGWDYAHAGDYGGYDVKWIGTKLYGEEDKKWTTEEIFDDVVNVIEQIRDGGYYESN